MRYRENATTVSDSGTMQARDASSDALLGSTPWSVTRIGTVSRMWDDPTGGRKVTKPCLHLSYVLSNWAVKHDVYHSSDLRNAPNPGIVYREANLGLYDSDPYVPPSTEETAGSYIPVTENSTDDIAGYVFQAYNQFVNSVTALDASMSIAESGETPRLFQIWQRRKGLATNLTNGFLSYSFGWKPLLSDLKAIRKELVSFPATVRKRLKAIGDGHVVRHYRFDCSNTVESVALGTEGFDAPGYPWQFYHPQVTTKSKSRVVVVTIRANVKPKLTGDGQDLLNKLGALGLIPSISTVWSVTRLSFVVDWFYNIGGAIENLQGSLTHNISDVAVCVSDTRARTLESRSPNVDGPKSHYSWMVTQRYYKRNTATVPLLPPLRIPRRPMQYVLLGLLSLSLTKRGKLILRGIDGTPLSKKVSSKIEGAIARGENRTKSLVNNAAKNGSSLLGVR